jgi:predicted HicB family RNase H-like nuclease
MLCDMKKAATKPKPSPSGPVMVRLSREAHRRLKSAAALEGREVQDALAQAVNEYLAKKRNA